MLIPLRLTSLFGPKSMKNKAAVPTTAMTAAAVTGTRFPRLSLLWACISLFVPFWSLLKLLFWRNKFQQTSPPADIPEKPLLTSCSPGAHEDTREAVASVVLVGNSTRLETNIVASRTCAMAPQSPWTWTLDENLWSGGRRSDFH
jgi:hypothetical protein